MLFLSITNSSSASACFEADETSYKQRHTRNTIAKNTYKLLQPLHPPQVRHLRICCAQMSSNWDPRDSNNNTPPQSHSNSWAMPSTVSSAVSGLLRRFSAEPNQPTSNSKSFSPIHSPSYPSSHHSNGLDGVYTPPYRTASPFQPPPLYPIILKGYQPGTPASAKLLTGILAEEIRSLVPPRLQLCEEWNLIYSLEEDGVSLGTLYKKCDELRGLRNGFVLVVKDGEGGVCFP